MLPGNNSQNPNPLKTGAVVDSLHTFQPTQRPPELTEVHPLAYGESNSGRIEEELRMKEYGRLYGGALVFNLTCERTALSQFKLTPGLKSSMFGLHTSLGTYHKFDFHDYLEDSTNNMPNLESLGPHKMMEEKLGL